MSASDAIIGAAMFALVAISAMAVLGIPVWRAVVMATAICLLALSLYHLASKPAQIVSRETVAK